MRRSSSFQGSNFASNVSNVNSKCQKCLKSGHWTADCSNNRVYKARPSRSKLLLNPTVKLPENFIDKSDFVEEDKIESKNDKLENQNNFFQ